MLQRVVRSTIIDAPIARVWAVLRDFNSHDQWHDVVESSRIEGGERGDQVGCVRSFTLKDGNRIREQLLTLSDTDHKSTYCIVEATVPLQRYVATVTLKPVTDGDRTFWHWESTFATPPGQERELRDLVAQGVYEAGFENLRRHLRQGGTGRAGRRAAPALPGCRSPAACCASAAMAGATCWSRTSAKRRRRARRGAHRAARDRRQLSGRLSAPRFHTGDAAAGRRTRRAGHGGRRHRDRCGRGCGRPAARRSGGLPVRRAGRLLQRALCAGRAGVAAARRGRRCGGGRGAAQGRDGGLPVARPRPCETRHARAGACGRRRGRAAGVRLGACDGRHRDRHGVE